MAGQGLVLMVSPEAAKGIMVRLIEFKLKSWIIGEAVIGKKEVRIV